MKTSMNLSGDTKAALSFLREWPTKFVHLVAIYIDPKTHTQMGAPEARAFVRDDLRDGGPVERWINKRQGKANIYFTVNNLVSVLNKKAKKTDVAEVLAAQIDIDLPGGEDQEFGTARLLDLVHSFRLPPSVTVGSGGGVQAFWFLQPDERLKTDGDEAKAEAVECLTRGLENEIAAMGVEVDACHNVDRIMRLPGTINIPNAKKIAMGRKLAIAKVVEFTGVTYPLSAFRPAEPKSSTSKSQSQKPFPSKDSFEQIAPDDPRLSNLEDRWKNPDLDEEYDGDRSRAVVAFAVACLVAGIHDDVLASCLMTWEIGQHIRDQKDVRRALKRTIERAKDFSTDPDLGEMNENHCVISDIGGKCFVLNETTDPASGDSKVTFSTFAALRQRYSNRWKTWVGPEGDRKKRALADWWLKHPKRRQCEQVVFAPGKEMPNTYNLWQGFAVEPDFENSAAKCDLYLQHMRDNICRGDKELYDYIIRWMANAVQNPGRPGGAALVLRGKMGIGKGEFVRHFGGLFGQNYIPVTKPEHFNGRFNGHMGETIVLFADECFFPGNPQHEQILKVLVTERQWLIEKKGIDAVRANSCLHLILACNNDWSVPVDADDRRFCCIEVGDARIRDRAYFSAIDQQMTNGGREALLGLLLQVDLTGFNPEDFPRTADHWDQRARTRHGVDAFIEELCHDGRLPCADNNFPDVAITSGETEGTGLDYYIRNKADPELRRLGPGKVKNTLKKWGCTHWRESRGRRRQGTQFPPLEALRQRFEQKHGPIQWRAAEVKEWETEGSAPKPGFDFPWMAGDEAIPAWLN
jgi:hypothetical protein